MNDEPVARTVDPDGREVVFDDVSLRHLDQRRPDLLEHLEVILGTVSVPDYHAPDPEPGRERFYRQNLLDPGRWLRVVVDFGDVPGRIVTVFVQFNDPRRER